jgi:hypothetical protein
MVERLALSELIEAFSRLPSLHGAVVMRPVCEKILLPEQ